MKYVVIIAIVILAVRVDYWLTLFEKASARFTPGAAEIKTNDVKTNREIVGMGQDLSLKQSKRETFLALLEDFRSSPSSSLREQALIIYKENPKMFGPILDKSLEAVVFRWRDLLNNNEPEVANFLLDLMNVLEGENLLMVKRFFSLWMEINMEHFIAAYARSKDPNCQIATYFGDSIPEEEKINEYYERAEALKMMLLKVNILPTQKALATNCKLVLEISIEKIVATLPPVTVEPEFPNAQTDQLSGPEAQPAGVAP